MKKTITAILVGVVITMGAYMYLENQKPVYGDLNNILYLKEENEISDSDFIKYGKREAEKLKKADHQGEQKIYDQYDLDAFEEYRKEIEG